ncbi:hypothetical protein HD554DRAFT_56408 [Boletus coccyginus]|nr:hypothetical protein HD554DRAFT_56408 [Boletus coccyginus]
MDDHPCVSASPRLAVPAHPLHTVAALSFICHVRLLVPLPPPHVNNYIAEIDALLAERRDYIARNGELTTSVGAFRAAYASSQDEVKKKSDEIAKLLAELHALKVWPLSPVPPLPSSLSQGQEKRVIGLLDGDGTIFSPDLISRGQEGGLEAARLLTEGVRHNLVSDLGHEKFQLWVYLFYNKRGLLETFARVGLSAARPKFDEFIIGFNQAAERFLMVDVGGSKEAADAKIKGHLPRFTRQRHPLPHPPHVRRSLSRR